MISATMWWLYSDSETMRPARNAPRASDKPRLYVIQAVPRQRSTTRRKNISRFLSRITWWRRKGTIFRAEKNTTTSPRIAMPRVFNTERGVTAPAMPAWPMIGSKSIMGTTAMSWNRRMPVASLPCAVSSSALSEYILSTMAVLLRDARKPKNTAWGRGEWNASATPVTAAIVSSTWVPPPMRNWRPERMMSAIENSSPTVKRSRTTPISARRSTARVSVMKAAPCGPMSTPVIRKPTRAGSLILWKRKVMGSETASRMMSSRNMVISCSGMVVNYNSTFYQKYHLIYATRTSRNHKYSHTYHGCTPMNTEKIQD